MQYDDQSLHQSGDFDDEGFIPELELEFRSEKGQVKFRSIGDLSGKHLEELRLAAGRDGTRGEAANALYAKALELLVESWEIPHRPALPIPRGPNARRNLQQVPLILLRQIERYVMHHLDPWIKEQPGDGSSPQQPARD